MSDDDGSLKLNNNPTTTFAATAATGRVQFLRLVTAGAALFIGLSWKLFMFPISIIRGYFGLVIALIGVSLWVTGSVLSFSLNMIGLTSSKRNKESPSVPPAPVAASEEVRDFLSEFEREYGKKHPNFVPEGFTEAVQRSRREFKLLFVYLHSPEHPDTPSFCKETLCSEILSAFVNDNFVAWGDSINANEGLKMSKSLKASKFPFWAVIMAAPGQSISLLRQFEGPLSPEEMVKELQSVLEENAPAIVSEKLDTNNTVSSEQEEEEEDSHRSALEADEAKENQKKEDEKQLKRQATLAELCEDLSLGPEPETGPDAIQILVRLPNGERKGRRFPCNATLQSLYDFVDASGFLDVGSYTLVTFFPRVIYGQDHLSSTLEELGLYPQASLFVELIT